MEINKKKTGGVSYRWIRKNIIFDDEQLTFYRYCLGTDRMYLEIIMDWIWTDFRQVFSSDDPRELSRRLVRSVLAGNELEFAKYKGSNSDIEETEYSRERDRNRAYRKNDTNFLERYIGETWLD